jgi:hypothetical protein
VINPGKTVLSLSLILILLSYGGAGVFYRNQSLRKEKDSAAWGIWQIPSLPAVPPAGMGDGLVDSREDAPPLPEAAAAERLKDDLGDHGLVLTGLKRISRPEGTDFIIQARGAVGGILRFLENLPRSLPGWCFRDLSLKRREDGFSLDLVVGLSKTAAVAPGPALWPRPDASGVTALERQLFTRYPREDMGLPGNPARLGVSSTYSSPPAWVVLSGVEKSGNQGIAYLFLDSRTGRVRRLSPGVPSGDWALFPGNPGWILRIGGDSYFLGGL